MMAEVNDPEDNCLMCVEIVQDISLPVKDMLTIEGFETIDALVEAYQTTKTSWAEMCESSDDDSEPDNDDIPDVWQK
jgi:regulator of RNase E activity RraB